MAYQAIPPAAGSDPWYSAQKAFIQSKVPQLTRFEYQKLGQYSLGAISVTTGFAASSNQVGGGIQGAGTSYSAFGTDIYQNIKTFFGFTIRGTLAITLTTKTASLGLVNAASVVQLAVQSAFDVDATKYILRAAGSNSVGTVVNDGLIHNFTLTGNGTTIMLWIDGVSYGGAGVAQSGATTEALGLLTQNTTAGDSKAERVVYGYVDP